MVSEADRQGLPAKLDDRAVCIGPPHPRESYFLIAQNEFVDGKINTRWVEEMLTPFLDS